MKNKKPKRNLRNFFIGIVVGFILWAIIREFIWPMFSA